MKKSTLILSLLFLVLSCGTKQKETVSVSMDEALALTDTVKMSSVTSELPILAPGRLFVADDHLILYQFDVDNRFQIYDLPLTGNCFSSGKIGRGPDEFVDPDVGSMLGDDGGFFVADIDAFKTVEIVDSAVKVTSRIPVSTDGSSLNGVIKVKDKFVNVDVFAMSAGYNPEGPRQFQIIGTDGVEKRIAELPNWDDNDDNVIRYFSAIVAKPDDDMFAAFYGLNFRKIRYYNLEGDLLKEISVDFPDYSIHRSDERYVTYGRPFASRNRIVVLCNNYGSKSRDRTPDQTEYQIWDWNGQLVHRLIVPMRLGAYTVDFSTGMLYAALNGSENKILYCDISEYL